MAANGKLESGGARDTKRNSMCSHDQTLTVKPVWVRLTEPLTARDSPRETPVSSVAVACPTMDLPLLPGWGTMFATLLGHAPGLACAGLGAGAAAGGLCRLLHEAPVRVRQN